MEQVSPKEVLGYLEARFRSRLEKARLYPELINGVAPHLRRLRQARKFLELGCQPWLGKYGEPSMGFLPYRGPLKALSIKSTALSLHNFEGKILVDTDIIIANKLLYFEIGEALPTFLPIPTKEDEQITMSKQEIMQSFRNITNYTRTLRRYISISYPPKLPAEDFDVFLIRRAIFDGVRLGWSDEYLFTSFNIFRTYTASEKARSEREAAERKRRLNDEKKLVESLPKKGEIPTPHGTIYEIDVSALPEEYQIISKVADKAYVAHIDVEYRYYTSISRSISTPLNHLITMKILASAGLRPHLYRRDTQPFYVNDTAVNLPNSVIHIKYLDNYVFFITPKPARVLRKTMKIPLAKPIITSKRLILIEP